MFRADRVKIISTFNFQEAETNDEVFVVVSAVERSVVILLTGQHNGDIDLWFTVDELQQILNALERAIRMAENTSQDVPQHIEEIRYVGSEWESVVTLATQKGGVELILAIEGNENEEDIAGAILSLHDCHQLLAALTEGASVASNFQNTE